MNHQQLSRHPQIVNNRYYIKSNIGNGNYGIVFSALDRKTNRTVAVKSIDTNRPDGQQIKVFIDLEVSILSKLKHPNILQLLDHFQIGSVIYLIYEYCQEGDLYKIIRARGKIDEKRALKIIGELTEAFLTLQKNNVIHRDLKPENVFFEGGIAKLGDFGLCTIGSLVFDKLVVGSVAFQAPEIFKKMEYSFKTDVYSCGLMLYEMLTGILPFGDDTPQNIYLTKMDLRIQVPSSLNISAGVTELLEGMVKASPQDRFSFQQVKDKLRELSQARNRVQISRRETRIRENPFQSQKFHSVDFKEINFGTFVQQGNTNTSRKIQNMFMQKTSVQIVSPPPKKIGTTFITENTLSPSKFTSRRIISFNQNINKSIRFNSPNPTSSKNNSLSFSAKLSNIPLRSNNHHKFLSNSKNEENYQKKISNREEITHNLGIEGNKMFMSMKQKEVNIFEVKNKLDKPNTLTSNLQEKKFLKFLDKNEFKSCKPQVQNNKNLQKYLEESINNSLKSTALISGITLNNKMIVNGKQASEYQPIQKTSKLDKNISEFGIKITKVFSPGRVINEDNIKVNIEPSSHRPDSGKNKFTSSYNNLPQTSKLFENNFKNDTKNFKEYSSKSIFMNKSHIVQDVNRMKGSVIENSPKISLNLSAYFSRLGIKTQNEVSPVRKIQRGEVNSGATIATRDSEKCEDSDIQGLKSPNKLPQIANQRRLLVATNIKR